jgi:hypothetical protein
MLSRTRSRIVVVVANQIALARVSRGRLRSALVVCIGADYVVL